jgi:uncharacterized membrane protein YgcG
MKNIFILATFIIFANSFSHAQMFDCNKLINDQANVLSTADVAAISTAATTLSQKNSADPRVIVTNSSVMQEQLVAQMKNTCASWQNPAHGVKANLIVFMVSTQAHKMGIFTGDAYHNALSEAVTSDIKRNYMGPYFRSGEWGIGLAKGINQSSVRISAFETAALHPNTVINNSTSQPTDFSGLWLFLEFLLGVLVIIGIVVFVLYRKKQKQECKAAQLQAISSRNSLVSAIARIGDSIKEKIALGNNMTTAQIRYDNLVADYSYYGKQLEFDPSNDDLSADDYDRLTQIYSSLNHNLHNILMDDSKTTAKKSKTKTKKSKVSDYESHGMTSSNSYTEHIAPTTTIHENSGNDLLTGVLIGEALSRPSETIYERPSHHSYHNDDSGWGSSSSSDFDSPSSSDWGSSSSSDWGSSSSSDFGGSSSDF